MADALTPNYNFTLPEVGASDDTWGNKLNTNWANLDTILKTKFANLGDNPVFTGGTITIDPPDGTSVLLNLNPDGAAGSSIYMHKGQSGQANQIRSYLDENLRWLINFGDTNAESGSNAGSDFSIYRYSDGGGSLGFALAINRASGTVTIGTNLSVNGTLGVVGVSTFTGQANFGVASFSGTVIGNFSISGIFTGNTLQSPDASLVLATTGAGTLYLRPRGYNSTSLQSWLDSNGDFHTTGKVISGGYSYGDGFISNTTTAYLCTSGAGTISLRPNGIGSTAGQTTINSGGDMTVNGRVIVSGAGNDVVAGIGLATRSGTSGSAGAPHGNIWWNGSLAQVYIDATPFNTVAVCDYRIKQDVKPLQSTWNKVKSLRPISYRMRDYEIFKADGKERWGFIAHELQENLLPTAATGVPNGKELQSPDLLSVVAALTAALQEAQLRIEALEAKLAA